MHRKLVETARRGLSRQPDGYGQIWLSAALLIGLPTLLIFSFLGILNGWSQPWPQLAFVWPPFALVLNGLARSVWLSRRLAERGQ
jgi:hypothetical protein